MGSHGSSSLLFVMKMMVRHFVSDADIVMNALSILLPSNSQGSRFWTKPLGSCRWPRNAEGTPLLNALHRIQEPPSSQASHVGVAPGEEEHQLNSSFSAEGIN